MFHFEYLVNDPTTSLFIPKNLPPLPKGPEFTIFGYVGATNTKYTLEHQAACAYYSVVQAIELANKFLKKPLQKWAATKKLFVHPRAGNQLNAFYNRSALQFFFANDKKENKIVYTANSSDIVYHELGHAILDAIRPDLFNMQSMEIWAFHEAFGDIHAALNSLQHDVVIDYILKETDGDLRKSNLVTKLAEEMGTAVYNVTQGRMGHTSGSLRNLVNNFVYIEPEKLVKKGQDNQLTSEPHSFSRVFSGAFYDILISIYEELASSLGQKNALIYARDYMSTCIYGALPLAPANVRFFNSVAKSMILMDKNLGGRWNNIINKCFISRNILRFSVKPMVAFSFEEYKNWAEETDEIFDEKISSITSKKIEVVSMPHHMFSIEAPSDVFYEFNENGQCIDVIADSADEIYSHANDCIDFLKANDMIRPDKIAPFEITIDGQLVRTNFACNCNR